MSQQHTARTATFHLVVRYLGTVRRILYVAAVGDSRAQELSFESRDTPYSAVAYVLNRVPLSQSRSEGVQVGWGHTTARGSRLSKAGTRPGQPLGHLTHASALA